jgi:pyruvate kinase
MSATPRTFRRAKIVCTIGPASRDPDVLRELVEAGADAVRVNFSHASHDEAAEIVETARRCAREAGRPLAIIVDLQGPKIRVGDLPRPLEIREGTSYYLVSEGADAGTVPDGVGEDRIIPTTYPELVEDLAPGDRILLDDGRLELLTRKSLAGYLVAEALTSGTLSSQKGINLPGVTVRAPSLTEKDLADLEFAAGLDVDCVALSYVRRPQDLSELRSVLQDDVLVIAKIEKDQALQELKDVIRESDAVMVARGDLGVELPYEDVPLVQKRIVRLGHELARSTITATQMLDSMTENARPTRAEVSDVATALLDGTDAVMLSAETAVGRHPVESVRAMDRIIRRIEKEGPPFVSWVGEQGGEGQARVQQSTSGAIAAAALQAIRRLDSSFLVTFTRSGFTARVVSAQRPPVPILAVTDQPRTYRQLALAWGVQPVLFEGNVNYGNMLDHVRKAALEGGFGAPGDRFVVTAGVPFHVTGTTNMMRIEEL